MVLELEQRTRLFFEDDEHDILDYVCEWQASGKTLVRLAKEMTDKLQLDPPMEAGAIRRWLNNHYDRDVVGDRLAEARELGAHVLSEEAIDEAENNTSKEMAPVIRVRNDARHWTAERWNRREMGQQKPGLNLTLNVGSLHLDAMRQRNLEVAKESAAALVAHARSSVVGGALTDRSVGESAIADAIDVEAEIISDDES